MSTTATKRTRLRKTEVVFLRTDGQWILSTPISCGFKHHRLGSDKMLRGRKGAVRKALEVLSR